MGMKFTRVDVREVWEEIKSNLANTLHPDNSLEECYHLCRTGQAHLFTCPEGFVILQEKMNNNKKTLFIWIAYGIGGNLITTHLPDLEQIAKEIKATEISFHTKRRGFQRVLPEGWEINYVEWKKKIDYGT
jgi:hypothetical protein